MINIDWKKLTFGYTKTNYNVRTYFKNGKWGSLELSSSETIDLHMAATALHYGQEAFEGLKAFMGKDGRIRVFRWEENAKRLHRSAEGVLMEPVPIELFKKALFKVINHNKDFVPPYGSGSSLYIRPLLIGSGAQVGVKPAAEYLFLMFVTPVGPYFKEGFNPVDIQIVRDFDRAAPLGTGHLKVGGNYAASLRAGVRAHDEGFASALFLDAKTKSYIDEAGPANFFGIANGKYITPDSSSILPSITNMCLQTLAQDIGLTIEKRHITLDELANFEEVGACGTAAVISPIKKIVDRDSGKVFNYCLDGKAGPISTKLYETLQGIQNGDIEDKYNWNSFVE
jgi:branched-chain amino acid aminotransferase